MSAAAFGLLAVSVLCLLLALGSASARQWAGAAGFAVAAATLGTSSYVLVRWGPNPLWWLVGAVALAVGVLALFGAVIDHDDLSSDEVVTTVDERDPLDIPSSTPDRLDEELAELLRTERELG